MKRSTELRLARHVTYANHLLEHGGAPIRSRYRKTHAEAWGYVLDKLRPDICLVQEALHDFKKRHGLK